MKKLAGAVNYRYLLSLLLSILFAFLIGAGILAVSGFHPLEAYGAMLSGAFDSARHIGDFLEYAMVLCVCGLACVLGARVGIFNVGGEGQLLLGAIFMAADYSTSPCTAWGKVLFGIGAGLLTVLIRFYGAYAEGVSFAILFMNILTPYLTRWTRTKPLGGAKA